MEIFKDSTGIVNILFPSQLDMFEQFIKVWDKLRSEDNYTFHMPEYFTINGNPVNYKDMERDNFIEMFKEGANEIEKLCEKQNVFLNSVEFQNMPNVFLSYDMASYIGGNSDFCMNLESEEAPIPPTDEVVINNNFSGKFFTATKQSNKYEEAIRQFNIDAIKNNKVLNLCLKGQFSHSRKGTGFFYCSVKTQRNFLDMAIMSNLFYQRIAIMSIIHIYNDAYKKKKDNYYLYTNFEHSTSLSKIAGYF